MTTDDLVAPRGETAVAGGEHWRALGSRALRNATALSWVSVVPLRSVCKVDWRFVCVHVYLRVLGGGDVLKIALGSTVCPETPGDRTESVLWAIESQSTLLLCKQNQQ